MALELCRDAHARPSKRQTTLDEREQAQVLLLFASTTAAGMAHGSGRRLLRGEQISPRPIQRMRTHAGGSADVSGSA